LLDIGTETTEGKLLVAAGGLGPTLSALGLLFFRGNRDVRRDYLRRLTNFRGITPGWWGFIFLLPLVSQLLSAAVSLYFGGSPAQFVPVAAVTKNLPSTLLFIVFVLFFGPVPEELGWRGCGLPGLLERVDWITASVITATFWAAWHVPLFFIPGYPLSSLAGEPLRLLSYFLSFFPNSLIYTGIFIGTGGSTLSAILFHFTSNFWGMVFDTGQQAEAAGMVIKYIAAGLLIARGTLAPKSSLRGAANLLP
jgi:membrane protease YdiL (CAAX protease family)